MKVEQFDFIGWDGNSGMEIEFAARKTAARKVYITKATLMLVKQHIGER